uniref:TFIIB-type zinc ribbon-containing protein n=1 Tax=Methanothermobacter thermautotrophicus TaxID=145262 RepID=UPI001865F4D9
MLSRFCRGNLGGFLVEYSERVKFREHQLNTLQLEDRRVLKEILFDVCPDCGSKRFRFDRKNYYIYCQGCGVVLSALYPYSAGLRLYLPWGIL